MRLPVILAILLSLVAVGFEQREAIAQYIPGIAPACGGCRNCVGCRDFHLLPRRACRRCRRPRCICRSRRIPRVRLPYAPACVTPAPVCSTPVTRMVPRRVVNWQMVPKTVYRQQAYCEQVPVTTYRRVVMTVPQTGYRNVMRYQNVPQQIMVPRRNVSTVWEPRTSYQQTTPMMTPQIPAYTGGCSDCGTYPSHVPAQQFHQGQQTYPSFNGVYPQQTIPPTTLPHGAVPYGNVSPQQMLTVPAVPQMGVPAPKTQLKVPTPVQDPGFAPTKKDQTQSSFTPWRTVPTRGFDQFEAEPVELKQGYRTVPSVSRTATNTSKFAPAPSAAAVQRTFR